MTTANFFKCGTLLIPSGPPGKRHLHVICADPDPAGQQILVSISTFKPGFDDTCILLAYQHDWLWKEKSFVDYYFANVRKHRELIEGVKQNIFTPDKKVDRQLFDRIRAGIERSPFTPGPIVRLYRIAKAAEREALTSRPRKIYQESDDEFVQ